MRLFSIMGDEGVTINSTVIVYVYILPVYDVGLI